MQIIQLSVGKKKCLENFNICFDINKGHGTSTILIGENGTGKSTLLQTVLEIMMSFDSEAVEKQINYQYSLKYFYKGSTVLLQRSKKQYSITIDEDLVCEGSYKTVKAKLASSNKSIFPERISYFYSGLNDRAVDGMHRMNINYKKTCRNDIARYWNALYLANHEYEGVFPKRKYNYCTESLVPIYLIALLCGEDSFGKKILHERCYINNIESISFFLNVKKIGEMLHNNIDEVGIEGVLDLISFIDDNFTEIMRNAYYPYGDTFMFDIRDITHIEADTISFFSFFEKLNTIFEAKIEVVVNVGGSSVSCQDLSEGQRQLIKILGMLCICKDEDTLVLMDEPDAHMNPKWKYELKETIDVCLKEARNTQAIIATHDPLVINGVSKEYVRIFTHNKRIVDQTGFYLTQVRTPTEDTEGLGIDGLLQSEYYGLKTSYDKKTTDIFLKRQELYSKLINGEATEDDKVDLRKLTKEVGALPVSYNSIDFLYDDFMRVYRKSDLFSKEYLSFEEIQERRKKIEEIIMALYEGEV